jgi:hypothetical protein
MPRLLPRASSSSQINLKSLQLKILLFLPNQHLFTYIAKELRTCTTEPHNCLLALSDQAEHPTRYH